MTELDRKDCPFRETCIQIQERAIARKDFAEARLGEAWKGARQQNKGMNRMARKIKRLQAENAYMRLRITTLEATLALPQGVKS